MKLQHNFTTREQSKRLIELGIPVRSYDCYYWQKEIFMRYDKFTWEHTIGRSEAIDFNLFSYRNGYVIPSWSVGRLIEILSISYGKPIGWIEWSKEQPPIETILAEIEAGVCQNKLDFSKLED